MTEGRRALRQKAAAIETGEECERLAPRIDGQAGRVRGGDLVGLGRHVRTCLGCRARLGTARAAQRVRTGAAPRLG